MKRHRTLKDRFLRRRSQYRRLQRLLFPSPAEVKFMRLMGAKIITVDKLKGPGLHFPIAIVISRGKLLRQHKIQREVRCGKHYVDFANDIGWALEVDGKQYHLDVVADFDRDAYLLERGWRVLHVQAARIWNDPAGTKAIVLKYLSR